MTKLIKKMKTTMKTSAFFSAAKYAPVDTIQKIDRVNGMDMFRYPSTLYTLK